MPEGCFFAAFGLAEFFINRSFLIIAFYCVASLVTFFVYTVDKHAARKGLWRIPEPHLHLLVLIGGWPGAILAQQKLRHKSKKQSFRFVFWITVMLNCAASVWLLTPRDIGMLEDLTRDLFSR